MNDTHSKKGYSKGFTLIELMIVIIIMGVLAALITGNYLSSLNKGRDARRKSDLKQIQTALELYYEDQFEYPSSLVFGEPLCQTSPCGSSKIYIPKVATDPVVGNDYFYESDGTYYKLYSCIENTQDQGAGVDQSGYTGKSCGGCGTCKFMLSSSNVE